MSFKPFKGKRSADLLRVSQHTGTDFIIDNHYCGLFSDMGFGKTVAVTTAVEKLFRIDDVCRVLVVSTVLVARETWPEEIEAWAHTSNLSFKLIEGDAKQRLQAAKGKEQIHITNQENFVWLAERAGRTWPYDMVVFDDTDGFKKHNRTNAPGPGICARSAECPLYENEKAWNCQDAEVCFDYTTDGYEEACIKLCPDRVPVYSQVKACALLCKQFKSPPARYTRFGALCALRPQIKRLVHLTGTPTGRGYVDLWPLIFTLDNGKRLQRTYTQYLKKYFNKKKGGYGWTLKPGSIYFINKAIRDICICIESEAKLPPRYDKHINITLPPRAAKLYDQFKRDLVLNMDDTEIVAANNGVLAGKLLQVCGGAVYTGEGREWVDLHEEKFKVLDAVIKKHSGEPILVGYNFKHELIRLRARYPQGIDIRDRRDAKHAWNAGDIPLMFAHPKSAGHGLNLQYGPGRVLFWLGLNWSLILNKQLNKRLHRPGQAQEVYIYYAVVKGRADTILMKGVAQYDWTQNQLLAAIKRQACKTA